MDLFAVLILVIAASYLPYFIYSFGENITNLLDNAFFKISQFGRHEVTNNELREKFK